MNLEEEFIILEDLIKDNITELGDRTKLDLALKQLQSIREQVAEQTATIKTLHAIMTALHEDLNHITATIRASQTSQPVCSKCNDRGWLYSSDHKTKGTCLCHY